MTKQLPVTHPHLPDQAARERARDTNSSVLVQAPAGSGKTTLLTERYLNLLGCVDDPAEIVAITFTNAAAAEMRNRVLRELEKADQNEPNASSLAAAALRNANAHGWKLLDQPNLLRVMTVDSFLRELALQEPLLSGLGGGLDVSSEPLTLYRKAARRTLQQMDTGDPILRNAIARLLDWRDNNWKDLEDQLVEMLCKRDQWMQGFVVDRETDKQELRSNLEQPFAVAIHAALTHASRLLGQVTGAREEALLLAKFACTQTEGLDCKSLAAFDAFPAMPSSVVSSIEITDILQAHVGLSRLVLTQKGTFRQKLTIRDGFPPNAKDHKRRISQLIETMKSIPGLDSALADLWDLPPACYCDEDWEIIHACFTALIHAAAQLKAIFAEVGTVDFIEVAQIARNALTADSGIGSGIDLSPDRGATGEAAFGIADRIRHILVDEFQDTSRPQHRLLGELISHWQEREGRTFFVVGDPLQSIYRFRDADTDMFSRVRHLGIDVPGSTPLELETVQLTSNFRTEPSVVHRLNDVFQRIFAEEDGSGLHYTAAEAQRSQAAMVSPAFQLHLDFVPKIRRASQALSNTDGSTAAEERAAANPSQVQQQSQVEQIIALCKSYLPQVKQASAQGKLFRVAILGRTRKTLLPIAEGLHRAGVDFRAVDVEPLSTRPEVLDALALIRAILNAQDRVAWLGVLRAPWCGLSLQDLYTLTSEDDGALLEKTVPQLMIDRMHLLSPRAQRAVGRVVAATQSAITARAANPTSALGSWLESIWLRLGGAACVSPRQRVNLDLLWSAIDALPAGMPDLLGTGLLAALDSLKAQPDPGSSTQCGIQLMTIHKSKGLEFEVVIVPDLQAPFRSPKLEMLSWSERAVNGSTGDAGAAGSATEFLIAPFQAKGADGGQCKKWVDKIRSSRDHQERRRLFYVATTRARDQLHLFARLEYKLSESTGQPELLDPRNSLFHTAWVGLEAEVRAQFALWTSERGNAAAPEPLDLDLAASAISSSLAHPSSLSSPAISVVSAKVLQMPAPLGDRSAIGSQANINGDIHSATDTSDRNLLHRLPDDFEVLLPRAFTHAAAPAPSSPLYPRQQGGVVARAMGTAIHSLLEQLAKLRTCHEWPQASAALQLRQGRVRAALRSAGIAAAEADRLTDQAVQIALRSAEDPIGRWILDPHLNAANEIRWVGRSGSTMRQVQADRVFCAGPEPGSYKIDPPIWWIIDYKSSLTAPCLADRPLSELRALFAPQLEEYSRIFKDLHAEVTRVFMGIYYPQLGVFDWWKPLEKES